MLVIGENVEILQVALQPLLFYHYCLRHTYATVDLIPLKKGASFKFYLNPSLFENSEPTLQSAGMIRGTGKIGSAVPIARAQCANK